MAENTLPVYDEEEAIAFIRKNLDGEVNGRYSDDDLMEIIDAIWDYYDAKGATSLDNIGEDDDEYPEPSQVAASIIKVLLKNGPEAINISDLTLIVKEEIAYEKYLDTGM